MVEETAIRVQINAAKLAGQGIFGILQAVASMLQARQYGQQSSLQNVPKTKAKTSSLFCRIPVTVICPPLCLQKSKRQMSFKPFAKIS